MTRVNRAGQTLSYVYDQLDRLHSKAIPTSSANAAHTVTSAYTLAGRTTSITDSAGPAIAYAFDTAGRATSETQTTLGAARTVAWALDENGNHTRLTWPDAFAVNYAYDALNRMSTATVNGGSQLAAYTYDAQSRRTAVSYNGGSSAMAYSYSNAGDLQTLTDDFAGSASDVTFTDAYTPAHQLAYETTSNAAYLWTPATASSSYAAVNNLNQYPSVNGASLTWDGNGNLATITGATYAHDPENRMVTATVSGTAYTYTYDPLGRRIAKSTATSGGAQWGAATWGAFTWSSGATATSYLHDGDNEIAEFDNSGTLIRRFVPGAAIDEPLAMITAAGIKTFFHTDRKGSVIAMADTNGDRTEGPYTYDEYGNCFVGASTTSCTTLPVSLEPFRYTGQRFDTETGLYYYRARYYHPGIGRFAETDPAGYKPDINWYSAFGNDPTDMSDPMGLYDTSCGSSSDGCATAIKNFEEQRQNDLKSTDPGVVAAAQAFGGPGEHNGVTINSLTQNQMDQKYGAHGDQQVDGHTNAGAIGDKPNIQVDISRSSRGDDLARNIGHEGTHVADAQKFIASFDRKTGKYSAAANYTVHQTEFRAYKAGAAVQPDPNFHSDSQLDRFIDKYYPDHDQMVWPTGATQ